MFCSWKYKKKKNHILQKFSLIFLLSKQSGTWKAESCPTKSSWCRTGYLDWRGEQMFDRPRNCCSSKHAVKKQNFWKRKSPHSLLQTIETSTLITWHKDAFWPSPVQLFYENVAKVFLKTNPFYNKFIR